MSDENECDMELNGNPLLMPGIGFAMWLSGKSVDLIGIPPTDILARAALLYGIVNNGKIELSEIKMYLEEVGLMVPITEN
jgi:hypothetical protein